MKKILLAVLGAAAMAAAGFISLRTKNRLTRNSKAGNARLILMTNHKTRVFSKVRKLGRPAE